MRDIAAVVLATIGAALVALAGIVLAMGDSSLSHGHWIAACIIAILAVCSISAAHAVASPPDS